MTFTVPQAPEWIARDEWKLLGWQAGWDAFQARVGAQFPQPDCSGKEWEEEAAGCPEHAARAALVDQRCAELAGVAGVAIEASQLPPNAQTMLFSAEWNARGCYVSSARCAVAALQI